MTKYHGSIFQARLPASLMCSYLQIEKKTERLLTANARTYGPGWDGWGALHLDVLRVRFEEWDGMVLLLYGLFHCYFMYDTINSHDRLALPYLTLSSSSITTNTHPNHQDQNSNPSIPSIPDARKKEEERTSLRFHTQVPTDVVSIPSQHVSKESRTTCACVG